jgi:hypothetical protein
MNCQDIHKFAFTYLDGEFDGRERGEFETHLAMCCTCRQAVERDAAYRDAVRGHLTTPACDPALRQRVRERLVHAQRQELGRAVIVPVALAAGLAITVVAWRLQQPDQGVVAPVAVAGMAPGVVAASPGAVSQAVAMRAAKLVGAAKLPGGASVLPIRATDGAPLPPMAIAWSAGPPPPGSRQAVVQWAAHAQPVAASVGSLPSGEVLRGALTGDALEQPGPFGAVRSEDSLRAMVRLHAAQLPPEVNGPATRVQQYLAGRVPGLGPLPVSEGAGVELVGARLAVVGAVPVVVYAYRAWGVALTVVSRSVAQAAVGAVDEAEVEPAAPDAAPPAGVLLDRRAGVSLLHVVSHDRVLTLVSELGGHALLDLAP